MRTSTNANDSPTASTFSDTNVSSTDMLFPITNSPSSAIASPNINSSQHSSLDTAAVVSMSVIGGLLVLSAICFSIFCCCRRFRRRKARIFAEQKQIVLPPDNYQRQLFAEGGLNPSNLQLQNYPMGSPYGPMRPYNIDTNLSYANHSTLPYNLQTAASPGLKCASEIGHNSYYGREKGAANRKITQQSPLSELGGDEWQTELDGRRRRSAHPETPVKANYWRDKELPTPKEEEEEEEGEVAHW